MKMFSLGVKEMVIFVPGYKIFEFLKFRALSSVLSAFPHRELMLQKQHRAASPRDPATLEDNKLP